MADWLPRDLQLEVVKRVDMDARIALGLVGRLRVPQRVVDALAAIRRPNHVDYISRLPLGIYEFLYIQGFSRSTGDPVSDRWLACVFKPVGYHVELQSIHESYNGTMWRMQ